MAYFVMKNLQLNFERLNIGRYFLPTYGVKTFFLKKDGFCAEIGRWFFQNKYLQSPFIQFFKYKLNNQKRKKTFKTHSGYGFEPLGGWLNVKRQGILHDVDLNTKKTQNKLINEELTEFLYQPCAPKG